MSEPQEDDFDWDLRQLRLARAEQARLQAEIARLREQLAEAERRAGDKNDGVRGSWLFRKTVAEHEKQVAELSDLLAQRYEDYGQAVARAEAAETALAELVRWRHELTRKEGLSALSHWYVSGVLHFPDDPCSMTYPDGTTECDWLAAHPLPKNP